MRTRRTARLSIIILLFIMMNEAWAQSVGDSNPSAMPVARAKSGKEIGSVIDFIVNLPTGSILFAVISPGKSHRQSTSVILLPWSLAQVDSTGRVFDFNITTDTVRRAPRVSVKSWKQPLTRKWLPAVETYWHTQAALSPLPAPPETILGKATALLGVNVRGSDNSELGAIRELVFDPNDGAIAFVVLARSTPLHEQTHIEFDTVPWEHLYVKPWRNTLIAVAGQKILT